MADANAPGVQGDEQNEGQGASSLTDDPKFLNALNTVVNSHLKRNRPKASAEDIEPLLAPLREQIAALIPKAPSMGAQGQGNAPADEHTRKLEALERKLAQAETRYQESEAKRVASEKAARDSAAVSTLRGELSGKVRPEALDALVRLIKGDGRIRSNDEGEPVFIDDDGDPLSVPEGVKRYLKSPEAALFLPAPGYVQGGQKPPVKGGKFLPRKGPDGKPVAESPLERTKRAFEKLDVSLK